MTFEQTPQEIQAELASGERLQFIDVREPQELILSRIDGAAHVPMQAVPAELQKIEALAEEAKLIVICHHGVRSLQVVTWLHQQGVENAVSLTGGIDRWSREIDQSIPRY